MNRKRLILAIGILIAVLVSFVLAGIKNGYFERKDTPELTVSFAPVKLVSGTITSMSGEKLTLSVGGNLALDPDLIERTVFISQNTAIIREGDKKNAEVYVTENENYMKSVREFQSLPEEESYAKISQLVAPDQYLTEVVSVADLNVGMPVRVLTDHDITNDKEFQAAEVRILQK